MSVLSMEGKPETVLPLPAVNSSRKIIHMDIKPQNFVFVRGHVKVIDLGCAERIQEGLDYVLSPSSKGTEVRFDSIY